MTFLPAFAPAALRFLLGDGEPASPSSSLASTVGSFLVAVLRGFGAALVRGLRVAFGLASAPLPLAAAAGRFSALASLAFFSLSFLCLPLVERQRVLP